MKILLAPSLKIGFTVFSMLLILLAAPFKAHACACCSDAGTWSQSTARADPEVLAIVGELGDKLGATVMLRLTPAGLEQIKGITAASETYSVRRLRPYRRWDLEFTDQRGNRGTLTFTIPDSAVFFAADLQDKQQAGAGGPLLYKEWRFEGPILATGIFRGGMTRNTRFRLIFQGRGNMCRNTGDFRSWILQVTGPRANYTFYGSVSGKAHT